jgi:hypothetical protein
LVLGFRRRGDHRHGNWGRGWEQLFAASIVTVLLLPQPGFLPGMVVATNRAGILLVILATLPN